MRKLLLTLLVACLATAANAAAPSDASVESLLVAMQTEKLTGSVFANVDQVMRQSMAAATQGKPLTPEQQRAMDATAAKFAQVVREEMSWEKMRPLYMQIYRESFSQEEIDGLIAFYNSPIGTAYVEKMPLVLQKTTALMQSRMVSMMERFRGAMREAVEEAKAAP